MNSHSVLLLGAGAGLVIAGVVLEGTQQSPWNLVISYMLPVAIIEALKQRTALWVYAVCAVVVGLAIYGAAWTLGPEHATSPRAALVYVGLVAAAMSSLMPARPV